MADKDRVLEYLRDRLESVMENSSKSHPTPNSYEHGFGAGQVTALIEAITTIEADFQ